MTEDEIKHELGVLHDFMLEQKKDHKHLDECVDATKQVMNERFDKTSAKIDRLFHDLDAKIGKLQASMTTRFLAVSAGVAGLTAGLSAAVTTWGVPLVGG